MNNQQNDDMDRQTLNVAFATQKGGSGKTAITVLVAGYLHYRLGCPLAVIDCDFPQYSLYEMRERDSRAVLENEHLKRAAYEQMRQPGRAAYPVRKCRVEQAPDTARELAAEGCYDLLFFDLPGTVNSAGILRTIAQMDYIFAPVSADKAVLESTLSFLDVLQRMMLGKETSRLKGLYLFWNQVDKRETSGLYEKYGQVVADMGLPMLLLFWLTDTDLCGELRTTEPFPHRYRILERDSHFRKEADGTGRTVFRSTLLAPDRRMLAGSGIPELTREIATILKLEGYEEAAE